MPPETITVPELRRVLQAAFGWENRHLFGIRGVDRRGRPRVIIGPDDAAEEMGDEPASGVVLFELLDAQRTGPATLEYEYDFGVAWTHLFEVVGPAELPAGGVLCIDGANRGPVLDAGGPYGYVRLIEALADPADEEHKELSDSYQFATGQEAGTFEPFAFDAVVGPVRGDRNRYAHPGPVAARRVHAGLGPPERMIADTRNEAGFRTRDDSPVPLDVAQEFYLEVILTLGCLQLTVPAQSFSDVGALTSGGRKFLLQVQRLLKGP